jgi:hypothetical protein
MKNIEEFFKLPAAEEFFKKLQNELLQIHRPANEVILDELSFCELLHISKRHSANLRATCAITYSKAGGKLYYKLSDILLFIDKHEIKSVDRSGNIFKTKNNKK